MTGGCVGGQWSGAFFCNSGLEANEAALKIARKFGHDKGIERPEIVVLDYAFVVSGALGYAVERLIGFRLIPEHEVSGIDLAIHGESAYDFHTVTGGRAGGHGILRSLSHPEED